MLLSNVEQIEKCQNSLIKRSKRGHNQSQGLEAATEKGRVKDIVGTAKQIDSQFEEMNEMMNRYDEVKKACQIKREEYVRHAERGSEELRIGVENQIDILSEFLDLGRFKKAKHNEDDDNQEPSYLSDINQSLCLQDHPLDREELQPKRTV